MNDNCFLPFALPDIGEEEIDEVVDSLRSGWVTAGPKTKKFELDFNEFLGGGLETIAVNSATSGLHLALEALGVSSGDEVITTPYTFTATAEVIRYLGAKPVLVDINEDTFNIDVTLLEGAISSRTKAIIPVHFAGLACDMSIIINIAHSHGIKVVEDAAHALPTRYQGNLIGSLQSDVTVYSFYATKTITTGEGGMIVTRDQQIAERCRIMRLHGISRDIFDRYTSKKPSWHYDVIAPGYKYNMNDLAASMGIHQLRKANKFQRRRQELADFYNKEFEGLPILLPPKAPKGDLHAWHLYIIRLTNNVTIDRNDFIQLMSEQGIGCSVHFIPLHLLTYWRDTYEFKHNDFPCALRNFECAVSLPLYTKMTNDDAQRVVSAVKMILFNNVS
ncbi:MAG: DegT/DnrJ/EryC1/StrS aminotransferase family protein [Gammaproteobacteria bacterium]|nr:DegT/DnrJ/EryC1/StrS aminotransferase family protein [Gammaproteobacteria bacterium]